MVRIDVLSVGTDTDLSFRFSLAGESDRATVSRRIKIKNRSNSLPLKVDHKSMFIPIDSTSATDEETSIDELWGLRCLDLNAKEEEQHERLQDIPCTVLVDSSSDEGYEADSERTGHNGHIHRSREDGYQADTELRLLHRRYQTQTGVPLLETCGNGIAGADCMSI